jgi:outer membrane murein-binding lipoprotein Lpp
MTTHATGPAPGKASGDSFQPRPAPDRLVAIRRAVVVGAVLALLVGALSAAGATTLARARTDDLAGRADTLTAQVGSLTAQVDGLTADFDGLTTQVGSLTAEKADLADTLAGTQDRIEALGEEGTALRDQLDLMEGQQPVVPDVTYGSVLDVHPWWYPTTRPFLLVVDVVVADNDAEKDAFVSQGDFRLKGLDDSLYLLADESPASSRSDYRRVVGHLPGGRIQLRHLTLGPSETVKGSLVFYVNKAVSRFTITYGGTTTALSL